MRTSRSLCRRTTGLRSYIRQLRLSLHQQFPGVIFYFLPADITTQTINFGLPAPLDIQVTGRDLAADQKVAADLAEKIRHVRGAVDVRIQQPDDLQRSSSPSTAPKRPASV
jgi:Putative silver efflux pump